MKHKFMFVGSLPTKKYYFDGERNKSRDVLLALKTKYCKKPATINLSKNQVIQVIKMLLLSFLNKYDFIFVSKCLVGGSKVIRYLLKFARKYNKKRIIFYIIGNGSIGFDDKTIFYNSVSQINHAIVESQLVKKEMVDKQVFNPDSITIVPCVKPNYDVKPIEATYPKKTLKLIFFSRVTELKGVLDAINAVIDLNEHANHNLFELDIAGGSGDTEQELECLKQVKEQSKSKNYINYLGLSLRIENIDSYKKLQKYDLHVFPSKFFQECAPGSIIDMFIAGIPTLSSNFDSSNYLLDEDDSYFYAFGDIDDFKSKLNYVYHHQDELNEKRIKAHNKASLFNSDAFINKVETILKKGNFYD